LSRLQQLDIRRRQITEQQETLSMEMMTIQRKEMEIKEQGKRQVD
jgi:hypothetical protein